MDYAAWIVLAIGVVGGVGYALWQLKFNKPKAKLRWILPPATGPESAAAAAGETGADETAQRPQTTAVQVVGRYPAVIFSKDPARYGIRFGKIPGLLGMYHYMDPTVPVRGNQLMVVESRMDGGNVTYQAYDPRHAPLLSEETPQKAYRAIVWDSMKRVYAYHFGLWEKVNTILAGAGILCMFILAAMLIDNLGKHMH